MRRQKDIEALSAYEARVPFPAANRLFDNYVSRLRELLSENVGGLENMRWDEHAQRFFFDAERPAIVGGVPSTKGRPMRAYRVMATCLFELDPRKPLMKELERLQVEVEEFKLSCAASEFAHEARETARELASEETGEGELAQQDRDEPVI